VKENVLEMTKSRFLPFAALTACVVCLCSALSGTVSTPRVELRRVPEGGIQPQIAVDQNGNVHLVYFKGDPSAGDLFYMKSRDGITFSDRIQVNSVPGSAIAVGNIRGPRIAVGPRGHVYIAWNGSAKMGNPVQGLSPMLYTRLNDAGTAFEPERNLIHTARGIDGGGGIAADQQGRVYVFWHAPIPGKQGEEFRRVWMTRSDDHGQTFEPEKIVWEQPTGACGCCSLNSYADGNGRIYVLFRSAQEMVHRDIYLIESTNHGRTFQGSDISKWNVGSCVMSAEAFASGKSGTFAAWETEKRVHFGVIEGSAGQISDFVASCKGVNEKFPALAVNPNGLLLVSWTEGMGWKRGGSVHWRAFDRSGQPIGTEGSADGVPVWSSIASYPERDGHFVVLY
jgi:hypothetical protein